MTGAREARASLFVFVFRAAAAAVVVVSSSERRSKHPVRPLPLPAEGRHSSLLGTGPGLSGTRRWCVGRFRSASSRTDPSSASLCKRTLESTCGAALLGAPPSPPPFSLLLPLLTTTTTTRYYRHDSASHRLSIPPITTCRAHRSPALSPSSTPPPPLSRFCSAPNCSSSN